jgi:glycosyltransferase involved in cell wall biosynthesis
MANKNVLIITYYWPPSGGAGVQRWLKFAKYLPEFGWNPIVYTPENPEAPSIDESLLADIPDTVKVIKKPIWEPYTFYKKFTGKKKDDKINAGFIQEKKSNRLLEAISVFIRGNFFIPDPRKFWVKPSVKYLKKFIAVQGIQTVITTGPPHSIHLIGLELKKALGISWMADFRDPWTNIDFYKDLHLTKLSDIKHRRLEKKVLSTADCVLTVGNTMAHELEVLGAHNVKVITNGYDQNDLSNKNVPLDEKFTLVHVGSLNKDRNHPVLWEALGKLAATDEKFKKQLEIKLVGKVDLEALQMIKLHGLENNLLKIDYLPHNEIARHLLSARILYLPINNTPNAKGILTGKFFEYMAAQRPILTIGLKESDVSDILNETGMGKVLDFDDITGVQAFISHEFLSYQQSATSTLKTNVEQYSRRELTRTLSQFLNQLSNA